MPSQLPALCRIGKRPGEDSFVQVSGHGLRRVHCRVHPFLIGTVFSRVQQCWRAALFAGQVRCSRACSPMFGVDVHSPHLLRVNMRTRFLNSEC